MTRIACEPFTVARHVGLPGIPCYRWRAAGPPRAVAIVVHGLGDHGRALPYRWLAEALVARGCHVITYDQRGHGASKGERGAPARLPLMQDDLCLVAAHVRSSTAGVPIAAIGISMGAMISLLTSRAHPHLFDGVVAASAPLGPIMAGRLAVLSAKALGRVLPGLTIATGLDVSAVTDNRPALDAYVGDPLFQTRTQLGLGADVLAAAPLLRTAARELSVPALFLHGRLDRLAPWDSEIIAELPGADRTVAIFERGYHNLFLDTSRDEVFGTIVVWIDGLVKIDE